MKEMFSKYRLQLVKDVSCVYGKDVAKKLTGPADVFSLLTKEMDMDKEAEEVVVLITADAQMCVSGVFEVSRGSVNASLVHPREIFKRAILLNAAFIFMAHNHPSGSTEPSKEDINITKRIKEAGILMGIELEDHIIVASDVNYISMKSLGHM